MPFGQLSSPSSVCWNELEPTLAGATHVLTSLCKGRLSKNDHILRATLLLRSYSLILHDSKPKPKQPF